jgi:hypothetical protein
MVISKGYIILFLALLSFLVLLFYGRMPQDLNYHHFADQRKLLGIPHFYNVITNLPFLFVGAIGLGAVRKMTDKGLKHIYASIFIAFLLLTAGSAYYHLQPNNNTLVYDRLPITVVLMSFFAFIIYERMGPQKGYTAFIVFNILGLLSVIYWILTERVGKGDVRWYALVQFFPIIAIPLLLWLYKSPFNYTKQIVWMFLFFGLAKLAERFDGEIYNFLHQIISGHSLKHLLMALAGFEIVSLVKRITAFKLVK